MYIQYTYICFYLYLNEQTVNHFLCTYTYTERVHVYVYCLYIILYTFISVLIYLVFNLCFDISKTGFFL